jgi:hypothetical protein
MLNLKTKVTNTLSDELDSDVQSHNKGKLSAADIITGKQTRNNTPLLVIGTLGIQGVNVLLLGGLLIALLMVALRPAPTLVQTIDGKAIRVVAKESRSREPQTITRFVKEVVTLMFSINGKLPPENFDQARMPQPDPGITIPGKNLRISTASFQAGFALSEDFRKSFLVALAELTPQDLFSAQAKDTRQSPTQIVPIVKLVSDPKQIKPGLWKLNVVCDLIVFNGKDQLGKESIPFNKEIILRAVEPPQQVAGTTSLEKTIYTIRQAGLEITAINDIGR